MPQDVDDLRDRVVVLDLHAELVHRRAIHQHVFQEHSDLMGFYMLALNHFPERRLDEKVKLLHFN